MRFLLTSACALVVACGSASAAVSPTAISFSLSSGSNMLLEADGSALTLAELDSDKTVNGKTFSTATSANVSGAWNGNFTGTGFDNATGDFSLAINADVSTNPGVIGIVAIQNNTAGDMDYTFTFDVTSTEAFLPLLSIAGESDVDVTGFDAGGTISSQPNTPIYQAFVGTDLVASLFDDPTSLTGVFPDVPNIFDRFAGTGPSGVGIVVGETITIEYNFTLSAG
ncbi:MAG: hypothetical protein AAGB34_03880, partial [Planctomycetota bacterium]